MLEDVRGSAMFPLVRKMKGDKLVLITDCTRAGGLEDGEYTLSITTQYASGNRLLKAPRTGTLNVPLYVGTKPDDEEEERPGGL